MSFFYIAVYYDIPYFSTRKKLRAYMGFVYDYRQRMGSSLSLSV